MSTIVELLPRTLEGEIVEPAIAEVAPELSTAEALRQSLASFAEEQLRGLVQQVFLSGSTKPCRQIVFSGADPQADVAHLCREVGETLASCVPGTTCVVEALSCFSSAREMSDENAAFISSGQRRYGAWRDSAEQLSSNLWFMPAPVFAGGNEKNLSTAWLRGRLAELRLEFEYAVIQGPACSSTEGHLLGALADGLVLVLEANRTRRVAAQKVKQALSAANVRLLGTVLSERTFPIPEAIYKRI